MLDKSKLIIEALNRDRTAGFMLICYFMSLQDPDWYKITLAGLMLLALIFRNIGKINNDKNNIKEKESK